MRVLQVIDSLEQGGAEASLVAMAPVLRARGVDVGIATLRAGGVLREAVRQGDVPLFDLDAGGDGRRAAHRLDDLLRRHRPDLVHTTLYEANQLGRVRARRAGLPVVSSLVNTPYGPDHLREPGISAVRVRAAQAVDIATARLVTRFHANADEVARVMARRLLVPRSRIEVVPRGRDASALGRRGPRRRVRVRQELGWAERAVVLAVARHEHQKGLDLVLDAAARIAPGRPDLIVAVAGRDGNATDALLARADRAGLADRVQWLGFRDDVADLLVAADVFVLASRREGFPGVVVEAMALEAPVVATDVPGTAQALAGTGLLVPIDDAVALAASLGEVLDEVVPPTPSRRPARSSGRPGGSAVDRTAAARVRFERHFALEGVCEQMASFYARALSGARR
jgi:glycosyltransferase involved in cell wall biosynthesis